MIGRPVWAASSTKSSTDGGLRPSPVSGPGATDDRTLRKSPGVRPRRAVFGRPSLPASGPLRRPRPGRCPAPPLEEQTLDRGRTMPTPDRKTSRAFRAPLGAAGWTERLGLRSWLHSRRGHAERRASGPHVPSSSPRSRRPSPRKRAMRAGSPRPAGMFHDNRPGPRRNTPPANGPRRRLVRGVDPTLGLLPIRGGDRGGGSKLRSPRPARHPRPNQRTGFASSHLPSRQTPAILSTDKRFNLSLL